MDFMAAVPSAATGAPTPPPLPVPVDPFDLAPFEARFDAIIAEVQRMAEAAAALEVGSADTQKTAVEMAGQAKGLVKRVEDMRKAAVSPHNEHVKRINGFCKTITDPLASVEERLKIKLRQYGDMLEQQRRAREAEERRQRAELQKRLEAEAKATGTEPVQVTAPVQPKAPEQSVVRTAEGSAHVRKTWKFEIVDHGLVPEAYRVVDEGKVRQAVAAGVREIPGVRIFEESTTVIRR